MKVKNKNGYELDFDTAVEFMTDEIREQVHGENSTVYRTRVFNSL